MKKFFASAAITLSVLLSSSVLSSASTMKEAADATYKLYSGDNGICSMTFVGNDNGGAIFLTAAHCVGEENLNVRIQKLNDKYEVVSEEIHYLTVLRSLKDDDTAILGSKDPNFTLAVKAADIATPEEAAKLQFGDDLIVLGYPAADEKSITKGNFTAKIKGVLDTKENYQTTVPVAGGNSGGGLYMKVGDEWKLVGTTFAGRRDNTIMTYFSVDEAVQRALAGFLGNNHAAPIDTHMLPGGQTDEK